MTTYLEPPLETLYHSSFRGLLRFCNIDDGYLLTLTVERRDASGRWKHLTTEVASSDFFPQQFEALVHTIAADENFVPNPLPNFGVIDGEPEPLAGSTQAPKPTELRAAVSVLLEYYFHDEKRRYETIPIEKRQNDIFEHWVAVLNWLNNDRFSPANFMDEQPATRLPLWVSLLILFITVPTLLYLPALFAS